MEKPRPPENLDLPFVSEIVPLHSLNIIKQ